MPNARIVLTAVCFALCLIGHESARAEGGLRGLLLRFDEPEGRRFTDYSGSGHTITVEGSVTRSTTEKKNGNSSVFLNGNGHLKIDASPDFVFSGDLTIDFWFKSNAWARQHALSFGEYALDNLEFNFADGGGPAGFWLYWNSSGGNGIMIDIGDPSKYVDGQWHHVAVVRSKDMVVIYMDGIEKGRKAYSGVLGSATKPVYVGARVDSGLVQHPWLGWIDELRIINGRALWTSGFDPLLYLPPPLNAYR